VQAPNPKHQITNNFQFTLLNRTWISGPYNVDQSIFNRVNQIQNYRQICFDHLNIGAWNLFGIWDLEFGI
jgi:hypothetical protein